MEGILAYVTFKVAHDKDFIMGDPTLCEAIQSLAASPSAKDALFKS